MKVLITGGSGKIGKLIMSGNYRNNYSFTNFDLQNGDNIFDKYKLYKAIEGIDAVIHLAAIPHPFHRHKSEKDYWHLNFEGTQQVFNSCKELGIKKFIFASSGCVYGFWGGNCIPDQFPIKEDNYLPSLSEGQTLYGATKIKAEEFLRNESSSIKTIALRIESPGKNHIVSEQSLITEKLLVAGDFQSQGTLHKYHFWACCSKVNFWQLIDLSLNSSGIDNFEVFNAGNYDIISEIDHIDYLNRTYNNVPIFLKDKKQALISVDKAIKKLNYSPQLLR